MASHNTSEMTDKAGVMNQREELDWGKQPVVDMWGNNITHEDEETEEGDERGMAGDRGEGQPQWKQQHVTPKIVVLIFQLLLFHNNSCR
jgi:hypothetical protein